MSAQHPVIPWPEAGERPEFIGSCDWGGCDHAGSALRWESNTRRYLTVCAGHSRKRADRHEGTAADCELALTPT